jgi:hypothetical protein
MEHSPVPGPRRAAFSGALALALTVGLALFAALAGPYSGQRGTAGSHIPSAPVGAGETPAVEATKPSPTTPLSVEPRLQVLGDPIAERLLVEADGLRFLDLADGKLGPVLADSRWPSQLIPTASGFICLCVMVAPRPGGAIVSLRVNVVDRSGGTVASRPVESFRGYDDATMRPNEQGDSVTIGGAVSGDGRTLYLGVAARERAAWRRSLLVIDVLSGAVRQRVALDTLPLPKHGTAPGPAYTWAPQIALSPGGGHAVVTAEASIAYGTERVQRWTVSLEGTRLERLSEMRRGPAALRPECGIYGFATEVTYYSLCGWGEDFRLVRAALDGSVIGETRLEGIEFASGFVAQLVDPKTNRLYLWNTDSRALARVDLATGTLERLVTLPQGTTGSGQVDVLGVLAGRVTGWIAPAARAKMMIEPALALSPDGSRLYALGMTIPESEPGRGRSAGIYVIDTATLSLVARWAPTADLMSIAASADGRYVYAAGMAGVDAAGRQTDWPASVTAYDSRTGEIRLIAGDLGQDWVVLRGSAP